MYTYKFHRWHVILKLCPVLRMPKLLPRVRLYLNMMAVTLVTVSSLVCISVATKAWVWVGVFVAMLCSSV